MSLRRVVSAVLIPTTLLLFTACTETAWIGPEQLQPEQKLKGVVTADGQEVTLDPSVASLRGDTIYSGYSGAAGEVLRFALDDVQQVGIVRTNVAGTVMLSLGIAAAAFGGFLAFVLVAGSAGD